MTPDEITSALSPQSCPSEFGADHKHGDLFGDETAPPHMTDAWRLHENTDLQVEEAMSGLYSSWEGPVFGGSNSEATGSELLLSGDGGVVSSWQSLSPTTPSTSIFPGSLSSRLDYHLGSPSPVPSMLADVEEELELGAPAQSSQEKPSWLTPNGKNNDGKGGKRHGMSWDHFGAQTGDISGFSPDRHRSDDLRILKSKHKPSAPRRNPASGKLSSPGAAQKVPAQFESSPGLSSLNIGDSALPDMPELSLANPQRKLTGRLPRKLLKKDGQTPRDFDGHTPRKSSGGDNMGDGVMGIEGSGMNLRDSHDSKATNEATVPAVNSEIESGDLRPLDNPSKALNACMGQISTDKWDTQLDGLTKLRQLAVHHPDVLRASANVGQVNKDVLAACNSLRSNLSKNALRCICDLFEGLGRTMDPHIENTVKVMMNRLTEASGFINGEAEKVLSTMVMCATDTKVLTALMAMSNHRHPIIRSKSALFVDRCCEKIGTGLPASCTTVVL